MTTEKNDAPSAEAIKRYDPEIVSAGGPYHVAKMVEGEHGEFVLHSDLARVRREARAEAFKFIEDEMRVEGRSVSADFVEALAAKERAK